MNISFADLPINSNSTVTFQSIQTIYEYRFVCTMLPMDFNYSTNPSAMIPVICTSGSAEKKARYENVHFTKLIGSGTIGMGEGSQCLAAYTPYFTTVGLYTDQQELVAVAKFPRAIQRVSDSNVNQSVIIKFDI